MSDRKQVDGPDPREMDRETVKGRVRERYGSIASAVSAAAGPASCGCGCGTQPAGQPAGASCCGDIGSSEPASMSCCGGIGAGNYAGSDLEGVPRAAVEGSLGCGTPLAAAKLAPGETVLDLGSGGGLDVFLAAKEVGPAGRALGLDFTDEMLALARDNQRRAGIANAEFIKGDIEAIPLPDASVDVVISNCVINLAPDKTKVFREISRVLRPGGRVAISDIVFQGSRAALPPEILGSLDAWGACVAGALEEGEYLDGLRQAGFVGVTLQVAGAYGSWGGLGEGAASGRVRVISGLVQARKPEGAESAIP